MQPEACQRNLQFSEEINDKLITDEQKSSSETSLIDKIPILTLSIPSKRSTSHIFDATHITDNLDISHNEDRDSRGISETNRSPDAFSYNGSYFTKILLDEVWQHSAYSDEIIELEKLGEGISGSVSKCILKHTGTLFALKTILVDTNPKIQQQILRELSINRTCSSEYIVQYYGTFVDEASSNISMAMEYCAGGSLDRLYKKARANGARIGEYPILKIAENTLKGLNYLHNHKIIHRDIKPSNILMTLEGQAKLCDFGVSGELVSSMAKTFTGTSYYMAPERIKGETYSITSDIWSLGLTLMEISQNRFPFPPEGEPPLVPIELLNYIVNISNLELVDEPTNKIKWSDDFKHFLKTCLERDGTKRPNSQRMLEHPWITKHSTIKIDMAKWIKQILELPL